MKKVLFATSNPSKVERFKDKLNQKGIEIITLADIDKKIDVEETGQNGIENALIKARAYEKVVNIPVLAMDDSLFFDGVPDEKQPKTHVRRVNGKRLNDDEMIDHYTKLASQYGKNGKITCRWIYGMAIINNGKENTYTWSKEDFYIVDKPSDKRNDGYPLNSISINKKLNKYFTDLTSEDLIKIKEDENDVIDFIISNI